jgi:hypothetical protein
MRQENWWARGGWGLPKKTPLSRMNRSRATSWIVLRIRNARSESPKASPPNTDVTKSPGVLCPSRRPIPESSRASPSALLEASAARAGAASGPSPPDMRVKAQRVPSLMPVLGRRLRIARSVRAIEQKFQKLGQGGVTLMALVGDLCEGWPQGQ